MTETKQTPDHSERPHAEFGPSSLKHVNACPGWVSRGGTSDAAEMGTRIHEAVEIRDPSALHDEKEVQIYNALIRDLEQQLDQLKAVAATEDITLLQEIRLDIALDGCETFGTCDILALAEDYALLHDHKTGVGRVDEPPYNWQSKAYAVGVFQKYPQVNSIIASFSIPQRGELLEGCYVRDNLPTYVRELSDTINPASKVRPLWDTGKPPLEVLSISNSCQYCKHQQSCPALGHTAVEIATRYNPDLLPSGPIDSSSVEDPEDLAKLLAVAKIVEKWAEGIIFKAMSTVKAGTPLPGYRLKSMGAKKNVVDKAGFFQYAQSIGFELSEVLELCEVPVGKLRDLYAARAPRGKKTEFARKFDDDLELERILEKGTERFTLVQE